MKITNQVVIRHWRWRKCKKTCFLANGSKKRCDKQVKAFWRDERPTGQMETFIQQMIQTTILFSGLKAPENCEKLEKFTFFSKLSKELRLKLWSSCWKKSSGCLLLHCLDWIGTRKWTLITGIINDLLLMKTAFLKCFLTMVSQSH